MRLTAQQVADHYGVEPRTVTNWVNEDPPCPSVKEGGRRYFDSVAVAAWREERARAEVEQVPATADFLEQKTRKMAADADRSELELAVLKSEFVPVELFRTTLRKTVARLRAQLLAIPGRYALRTVGARSLPESQRAWTEAIHDVLRELSQGDGSAHSR